MIILPKHKAVYISHQRCGSHTMFDVLCAKYDGYHCMDDGYHGRVVPVEYRDWFWFSTCRNPYSLAVSIWRATAANLDDLAYSEQWCFAALARDRSFTEFTKVLIRLDWSWKPTWQLDPTGISMSQTEWFEPVHENLKAVLQIESLSNAVTHLPFWQEGVEVGHAKNRTDEGQPAWQTYYEDPEAVANVQRWAGQDFEIFGYDRQTYKLP